MHVYSEFNGTYSQTWRMELQSKCIASEVLLCIPQFYLGVSDWKWTGPLHKAHCAHHMNNWDASFSHMSVLFPKHNLLFSNTYRDYKVPGPVGLGTHIMINA